VGIPRKRIGYRRLFSLALVLVVAIGSGCFSRFRSSRSMNLNPFAEDMIAVAGDIQYNLGQTHVIYLREYRDLPEVHHLDAMAQKAGGLIRGVIAYSIQIVTLSNSNKSDPEKAKGLADYLDGLVRPMLTAPRPPLKFTEADLDTLVANIGSQKNLLNAIGAAQPFIDEVSRASGEFFDQTKTALDDMIAAVQAGVDRDILPVINADRLLRNAQIQTTYNLEYLQRYRLGDEAALDSLFANEPSLHEFQLKQSKPDLKFMESVENRLSLKLQFLREVRDQLQPDVEIYWKQQEELETISASYNQSLRQARVAVVAWGRAHARLAAGVTNPAEINLLGIARKAAGSAVPIP